MSPSKEACSMVVVECGARLPDESRPRHPTHLLVRQRDTESPGSLLARIRGELSYLDANARNVDDAFISCGHSIERTACEARERLTTEVLERLRKSRRARLVLFVDADAGATLREELALLAERARAVLAEAGGTVTVRFADLARSESAARPHAMHVAAQYVRTVPRMRSERGDLSRNRAGVGRAVGGHS